MINSFEYFFRISIPSLFDSMCPDEYQIASVLLSLAVIYGIYLFRKNIRRWRQLELIIGFAEYIFMLLYVTIFDRIATEEYQYELIPLWSYWVEGERAPNVVLQILLNVALFLPLGFLLRFCRRVDFKMMAIVGCVLSIVIELLQLITRRGLFEVDDIIHNTLGCVLGYGLCHFMHKLLKASRG